MTSMRYDASGWAIDPVRPLDVAACWTLLAPHDDSRMDGAQWKHQAERHFAAELTLLTGKQYDGGARPRADCGVVAVGEDPIMVRTMPLDDEWRRVGARAADSIGGAGFDVLVRRARRLWQVEARDAAETAPLLLTAVLASVLLAPVLPPGGDTIFGVKGCRERLMALARIRQ
jgi:hypothetical protein